MRSRPPALSRRTGESRCPFWPWVPAFAGMILVAGSLAAPAAAGEALKPGGTLTYLIAADAPPGFDAHREATFATVDSVDPFYSVLIRVAQKNPSSNNFVCDLCSEIPQPTNNGKTYTLKTREAIKWHDGSPLTAAD